MQVIDYLTVMLINMVSGLVILAGYLVWGLDDEDQRRWAPGLGIVGVIALVTGMHMSLTWPLPGSHNILFGETSVLFGALFLAAAVSLLLGWDLLITAVYAFFAGLVSAVLGARVIDLGLTRHSVASGLGFILTGLGGVFAAPTIYLRSSRSVRLVGALVLLAAAAIWAYTGYNAYWGHLASFANWSPLSMR